jgi:hypothetical protein
MTTPLVPAATFTDEFLEQLRAHGDPEVDAMVRAHIATMPEVMNIEGTPATATTPIQHTMQRMLRLPIGSDDHDPPIVQFIRAQVDLPPWADPAIMREGQDLFWTYAPQFGLGLWMASLPSGYAGERDATVLAESVNSLSNARSRFLETGQFVLDAMTEHGLVDHTDPDHPYRAGGIGYRDIRHVRLVHSMARCLIQDHPELTSERFQWEPSFGTPINQMSLLATMFTFCVVGIESIETFGVRLTQREREAYVHVWNVIGHLMGIRDDVLPIDHATSVAVWRRIQEREYAHSEQGVELTQAALDVMQQLLPGRLFDGFPATGIRLLVGDSVADLLAVPPANWTRAFLVPTRMMNAFAARFNRDIRAGRHTSRLLGKFVFAKFLSLEAPRQGYRTAFELDEALRRRIALRTRAERVDDVRRRIQSLRGTR